MRKLKWIKSRREAATFEDAHRPTGPGPPRYDLDVKYLVLESPIRLFEGVLSLDSSNNIRAWSISSFPPGLQIMSMSVSISHSSSIRPQSEIWTLSQIGLAYSLTSRS